MSWVVNVILKTSIDEDITEFNKIFLDKYSDRAAMVQVDGICGGWKAMECDVYLGAFTCFSAEEILEGFLGIEWECPEFVQLFIQDQDEDIFEVYRPTQNNSYWS